MTLEARLIALAQGIGADIKALGVKQGDLTALPTTAKANLVAAIAELHAALASAGVQINDTAGDGVTNVTWSANKIFDTIEAAKTAVINQLTGGASAALDTFAELQAAIGADPSFAATMATSLSNRVRFDAEQILLTAQKLRACQNIGVGDPDVDLVAAYTAAKA